MLSQEPKPPDPDQIFSRAGEDTSKGSMLGERNVDSVLFKISDLPDSEDPEPAPEQDSAPLDVLVPPREIEDAKMDSGLVDVNSILREPDEDEEDAAPVGSLVAEMQKQAREAPPAPAPQSKTQTYVLVAGILALLAVTIMLAIKAVG